MANHSKQGWDLVMYCERRRNTKRRRVNGATDSKGGPIFTNGHYGKPSRQKRKDARAKKFAKAA